MPKQTKAEKAKKMLCAKGLVLHVTRQLSSLPLQTPPLSTVGWFAKPKNPQKFQNPKKTLKMKKKENCVMAGQY